MKGISPASNTTHEYLFRRPYTEIYNETLYIGLYGSGNGAQLLVFPIVSVVQVSAVPRLFDPPQRCLTKVTNRSSLSSSSFTGRQPHRIDERDCCLCDIGTNLRQSRIVNHWQWIMPGMLDSQVWTRTNGGKGSRQVTPGVLEIEDDIIEVVDDDDEEEVEYEGEFPSLSALPPSPHLKVLHPTLNSLPLRSPAFFFFFWQMTLFNLY